MIYFIEADGVGHIKIGFTDGDDAAVRMAQLQTGSPVLLRLLGTIPGTLEDENALHRRFAHAKVCREWFKPTPELVALIPVSNGRSCGTTEVVEKSVRIRVLTVGRKQFGRALLDQLPRKRVIDWDNLVGYLYGEMGVAGVKASTGTLDLGQFVEGDVWGWVRSGDAGSRILIFSHGGRLFKSTDWKGDYQSLSLSEPMRKEHYLDILTTIYPLRMALPGWRGEDQLFIGV
jgi:hypothetical protein